MNAGVLFAMVFLVPLFAVLFLLFLGNQTIWNYG